MGVDGFIPNQHLGVPKGKKASDMYEVDDDVPARVIEFDKENKKIVLSVTEYFKQKEQTEWEDYLNSHGVPKTTLEEVVRTKADAAPKEEVAEEKPAKKKTAKAKKVKEEKAETKETVTVKEEDSKNKEADSKAASEENE